MQKFILITATFGVPLMIFMGMKDAVGTFYAPDKPTQLAYQVVEIEEEPVVEEEPEAEAEAPEVEASEEAAVEPEAEETVEVAQAEETVAPETTEAAETADAEAPEVPAAEAEVAEAETEAPEAAVAVAALSEEDMAAAARAMRGCKACHQWERERNGAGPHLVGVVGRPIGSVDGFRYSDALLALNEAGDVWTVESLEVWLEDPDAFADGTKMNYKVRDAEDRRLIAAYLAAND